MKRRSILKSIIATPFVFSLKAIGTTVSVNDYSSVPAAITAAGVGGTIYFPEGVHYQTTPWTLLDHQTIKGASMARGAGGSIGSVIKSTVSSGVAFTLPSNNTIVDIELQGPRVFSIVGAGLAGPVVDCLSITGNPLIENVRFRLWRNVGVIKNNCNYGKIIGGEIDRCDNVLLATTDNVYNFEFSHAKITNCDSVITGSNSSRFHALKFIGGSIESYTSAFNAIHNVTFTDTYFETFVDNKRVFVFNSVGNSSQNMTIVLKGCTIFMNHVDRFINLSGVPDANVFSIGNTIITGTTIAGDTATAGYTSHTYLYASPNHTGKVTMNDVAQFNGVSETELNYINNPTHLLNQQIFLP